MPGQHLKGKICGQAIRRDMVDEIKSCSKSKFRVRALDPRQKFMLYLS